MLSMIDKMLRGRVLRPDSFGCVHCHACLRSFRGRCSNCVGLCQESGALEFSHAAWSE
jgi:hypothetical protein